MVPISRSAILMALLSTTAAAQKGPLGWFPLQVGARWVYEHEAKTGSRGKPDVDRWTTEETITHRIDVPDGVVVLREVMQEARSTQQFSRAQQGNSQGYLSSRDREPYLVHGDCVYVTGGGWDAETQRLRPDYRQCLSENRLSPDFCFPLQVGRTWGNIDIPWQVQPARKGVASFLLPPYAEAYHIFSSHFGSGGWMDVWFQKGVGRGSALHP